MRKIKSVFTLLPLLMLGSSCGLNTDNPPIYADGLSGDDLYFLDTIGVRNWSLDSMMGFNGKTLAQDCADTQKIYLDTSEKLSTQECVNLLRKNQLR